MNFFRDKKRKQEKILSPKTLPVSEKNKNNKQIIKITIQTTVIMQKK